MARHHTPPGSLIVAAAVILACGTLSCDDDVEGTRWVKLICDKYSACGMLQQQAIYGTTAEECVQAYTALLEQGRARDPDPAGGAGCGKVVADTCFNDFKAQTCADFTANKPVASCACEVVLDGGDGAL